MALVVSQALTETLMETATINQNRLAFHYMQNFDEYATGDSKYTRLCNDYIVFYQRFVNEFNRKKGNLQFVSEDFVYQIFDKLCPYMLSINDSKISFEISYENSIIFTLKKDGITCFVEQFFDENEELVFYSAYNSQNIKISYTEGSIDSVVPKVYNVLS